ncbi:discoidin domain-containing protein, partial [Kibdelosporangium lantanae]
PATASSTENASTPASAAVDGNTGTRWSSAFSDPQWIQVDLGQNYDLNHVTLTWEAAGSKAYTVQTSTNASSWNTIYTNNNSTGGIQDISTSGTARYIRVNSTARLSQWGNSLYEIAAYGPTSGGGPDPTLLSQGHPATASSTENASTPASAAVDGNTGTRWSSAFSDPQWIQVDLG